MAILELGSVAKLGMDFQKEDAVFASLESLVYFIAISPDGRRVIVELDNSTLQLLDLISGKRLG